MTFVEKPTRMFTAGNSVSFSRGCVSSQSPCPGFSGRRFRVLEAQGVSMCAHVCPQRSLADACGVTPLHSQFMELSGVCGGVGGGTGGA